MANPKPICKFNRQNEDELASQTVGVRLPVDMDAYVRSLPNRTEWLRRAIAAQIERDMQQEQAS